MRPIVFLGLLFVAGMASADVIVQSYDGTNWHSEIGYSVGVNNSVSLALDSSDHPHISVYDLGAGQQALRYVYSDGANWQSTIIDANASSNPYGTSIKLTSSGEPRISYIRTGPNSEELRYASLIGGSWSTELADGSPRVGHYSSLALDSSDNPHISYFDFEHGDLKLALKSGSWTTETIDSNGLTGIETSMALFNGMERIAYGQGGTIDQLHFAERISGNWSLQTIDPSLNSTREASLALDSLGNPSISYTETTQYSNIPTLKFAKWNPTTSLWDISVVDTSTGVGPASSLAIGADGTPHISYSNYNYPTPPQVRYATLDGNGNWTNAVVAENYGNGATSIALNSQGLPVIAYGTYHYPLPEPSTFVLGVVGLFAGAAARRRRTCGNVDYAGHF